MVSFLGAFDDSGKTSDSDFVCLCGYVAERDEWQMFEAEWNRLLNKHGIPFIHMKQLIHLRGPFARLGWDFEKRDAVLHEFIHVIGTRIKIGMLMAVDAKHWKKMRQENRKVKLADPLEICFYLVLQHLTLAAENKQGIDSTIPEYQLTTVFDDSEQSSKFLAAITEVKKHYPELKKRIRAICFADDEIYPPLQAADILSHQINKNLRQTADRRNTTEHFDALGVVGDSDYPELKYSGYVFRESELERHYEMVEERMRREGLLK